MNDLFPPAILPEAIYSPDFRMMPMIGNSMEPTLRSGSDYVLLAPVSRYLGEGIYALDYCGGIGLLRCQFTSQGVRLSYDNESYGEDVATRAEFEDMVVAEVIANIKVQDPDLLAHPRSPRQNQAWRVEL